MKFPQPSLARQALPDRPDGSTGGAPRLLTDSPTVRRVLELLTGERCNVLVTSRASGGLDLWGRTVAAALRSRADVVLEIYMPASAEALVARFNSAMASHSLVSARTDGGPGAALRVLLVADSRALLTPEGQLLTRLVGDFPAAGVRLLVLADADADAANRTVRDILARRVRHVALESDSVAEPVSTGVVGDPGAGMHTGRITVPAPVMSSVKAYRLPALIAAGREGHRSATRQPASRGRRMVAWGALVLSIALIAALIIVLLYRDRSPAGATLAKPAQAASAPQSTGSRAASSARGSQP